MRKDVVLGVVVASTKPTLTVLHRGMQLMRKGVDQNKVQCTDREKEEKRESNVRNNAAAAALPWPTDRKAERPTKHSICSSITISIVAASDRLRHATRRRICFAFAPPPLHWISCMERRSRDREREARRKKERHNPETGITHFLHKAKRGILRCYDLVLNCAL